jgi:4-amino-4-deoxy-L-arabinose transferase-like glycosyltransferase
LLPVFVLLAFRVFLAGHLGLTDDEAYYWDWTRQLDWSYYDHPALTTWLIALSQSLFGQSVFAVRLPAILSAIGSTYLVFRLSYKMFGPQAAKTATLLFSLTPIFGFGSILIFPDIPLLFLWLVFMNLTWGVLSRSEIHDPLDWLKLGAVLGVAMLAKYPAVFLAASLFLLMLFHQPLRWQFQKPGVWGAALVAAVVASPILIWNLEHDFPSFQYHLASRHKGGHLSFTRYAQFLATQAGVLTPFLFFGVFASLLTALKSLHNKTWAYIVWFSLPPLLVFYWQPLYSNFKPHWPAPAYLPLLMCLSAHFVTKLEIGQWKWFWRATLGFLIFFNGVFYTALLAPVLPVVHKAFSSEPWQPRFDITNDFHGWPEAGAKAAELLEKLKGQSAGKQPFLATHRYQLTAPLGFYSGTRAWNIGKRTEQYDFWQTEDAYDAITGADAIVVADNRYFKEPGKTMRFESCEKLESLKFYRFGQLAREFHFWHCHSFIGPKKKKK